MGIKYDDKTQYVVNSGFYKGVLVRALFKKSGKVLCVIDRVPSMLSGVVAVGVNDLFTQNQLKEIKIPSDKHTQAYEYKGHSDIAVVVTDLKASQCNCTVVDRSMCAIMGDTWVDLSFIGQPVKLPGDVINNTHF